MNVFSLKSLALYSLVIASAIGFFQIVTSYGEANIKAPIAVGGNYLITAAKLPDCSQNKQLLLKLQQSGIYLNASLIDRSQVTTNKGNRPTLSGRLNSRKMYLAGLLPPSLCDRLSHITITGSFITLPKPIVNSQPTKAARILAQQTLELQGELKIDRSDGSPSTPFNFTGIIQPTDRLPLGAATTNQPAH